MINLRTGWMDWNDIQQFQDELVNLEYDLIKKYHYPDRNIPIEYARNSVENLPRYLADGNTYFWAALENNCLIGYYWAYVTTFLCEKRWVLRSLYVKDQYKGLGIGKMAVDEGLKKAKELKCFDAVTEYVPFNTLAGNVYEKAGYQVSRIEVVRKI